MKKRYLILTGMLVMAVAALVLLLVSLQNIGKLPWTTAEEESSKRELHDRGL